MFPQALGPVFGLYPFPVTHKLSSEKSSVLGRFVSFFATLHLPPPGQTCPNPAHHRSRTEGGS